MKIDDYKDNRNNQSAWAGDGAIEIEGGQKSITGCEATVWRQTVCVRLYGAKQGTRPGGLLGP